MWAVWDVKIVRDDGEYETVLDKCPGHVAQILYGKLRAKGYTVVIGIVGYEYPGEWCHNCWRDNEEKIRRYLA